MRFRGYSWTAGARKHGVSREQARHVVEQCGLVQVRRANPPDRPDEAFLFLGDDAAGAELEIVGVLLDDGRLRVIHAMPMRQSYRPLYEEAKRWRL
ncbi:MAG: hypothetical protein QOG34_1479 [Frankiaceae bacterium]|nr:hypothetical protein [Frankiaceae bacterium]